MEQNPKRRPERPPFEQFITFASIKTSDLVDTRQRQFERHTTLNHQKRRGSSVLSLQLPMELLSNIRIWELINTL
jgi:hypothetical protein